MHLHLSSQISTMTFLLLYQVLGAAGAKFTFRNDCQYTVWPGILSGAGHPSLDSTGFELPRSSSRSFDAPAGWSGRFWGRTSCKFDAAGRGSCTTGDCGSGRLACDGAGANPPVTLAEFTLGSGASSKDFYDVSLVDGYNLPMVVVARGNESAGECAATGCVVDINQHCPAELRVGGGEACSSACRAFGSPEFCCSEEYSSPTSCRPSTYSEVFKKACPRSYSYAFDDATSTFTCTAADYEIVFCPSSPSRKSSEGSSAAGGTASAMQADNLDDLAASAGGDSVSVNHKTATFVGIIFSFLPFLVAGS